MLFGKPRTPTGVPQGSLFPIQETETVIAQLAGSFPQASKFRLEVFGYLIGLDAHRLTHLVIPEYLMGVRQDRNDEMRFITDTRGRTLVMFCVHAGTGEPGILVTTSPQNIDRRFVKGHLTLIPMDALILNRPLVDYLPAEIRLKWFPATRPDKVGPKEIVESIQQSEEKIRTYQRSQDDRWVPLEFVPQLALRLDAFVSSTRVYPLNDFILNALALNQFEDPQKKPREKVYGRVHVHYAYRYNEIMTDDLINALHQRDEKFFELMTPLDAISMLQSGYAAREIGGRPMHTRQRVEGIVALDPRNLDVMGASYVDINGLASKKELETFKQLAGEAHDSRNIAAHIRWFDYIRKISRPTLVGLINPG